MTGQQLPSENEARAGGGNPRWPVAAVCLVLAEMSFAVFGQTLWHGFVNYDDDLYSYGNPVVLHGLSLRGIAWEFTHLDGNLYHPLTMLSLMADGQIWGLHAGGYHLTSLLLHTSTAILLFLVFRQMTGALWRSAFVAAVFAVHPLRVESVAWVAERKDVLSGLFFVLTIWAYARYARRPESLARYGLVMLLFALGLLSKPMLVTLPLVLLLLDYWPLQRKGSLWQLAAEKAPLLALSAAACVATYLGPTDVMLASGSYTLPLRLANALVNCKVYLDQMIYPVGLAVFYPAQVGFAGTKVAVAGALVAALSVIAWRERRAQPWLLTGWLWYLVMLLPVAGIVQVGVFAHADRYTYLPQIGLYVMVAWWVAQWRLNRAALGALMAGVLAALMVCAWKQTAHWQNGETLWTHTLACTRDNYVAHLNYAQLLLEKGQIDDAMVELSETLRIKPRYADARYDYGIALLQKGKLGDAIDQFQQAIDINPGYANAHNNLGNALCQSGRLDEGMAQFQQALQINPLSAEAHFNLGNALLLKGRTDEAIAQFKEVLQINPGAAQARQSLQRALLQKQSSTPPR